jgi:elongation factor G
VDGHYQIVKVQMPLVELDHYATVLRAMTQGRATYSAAFAEYTPVPNQLQQKLHAEYVKHAHEDE